MVPNMAMDRPIKILDRVTMLLIGFLNSLWGAKIQAVCFRPARWIAAHFPLRGRGH
jgi:hypothetical protein